MKVAILWLINENNEILLSQRAAHISTDAGKWGPSVSGVIDEGEEAEQAAAREANEELGIDPAELIPIHYLHIARHRHSDGNKREFHIFHASVSTADRKKFILAEEEVADARWITLQELKREYQQKPEGIIISSNAMLWNEIFVNLESAINSRLA